MRDRPFRTPRAPRLEWPGGIVPEWAKAPKANKFRKGARGKGGPRERLQKVMAQSGHGSRRNIEILIAQGHVTINGELAKLGDQVGPGDRVKLDGKLIPLRFGTSLPRVLLYHKPEGEICTRDDPENRPTVFAKLPRLNNARWVSIGRLDYNTSGLLMFTTDGELANHLMHPRYEIEREYAVRLMGELTPEQVQRLTTEGVDLDGDTCRFIRLVDRGGEGSNHWYHVVLQEGKNREVRRLFEAVGLMVSRLIRVRYGPVEMPRWLKRGMMRDMPEEDVVKLMQFAGMNEPTEPSEEDDDEYAPGNVAPPGEKLAAQEEEFEDDTDELQPAHLMEGYKPFEPEPVVEEDDDRQPDFERLPGFNRATGSMGLPAGHRGKPRARPEGWVPGQGQGQGQGQGGKRRRGKHKGPRGPGMPGNVAQPGAGGQPGFGGQPNGGQPGQSKRRGFGKRRGKGPFGGRHGQGPGGPSGGNGVASHTTGNAAEGGAQPGGFAGPRPPQEGGQGKPKGRHRFRPRGRHRPRNRGPGTEGQGGASGGGSPTGGAEG